jgi:N-acetylglucosamine kinase-like BadF-type ATPase
MARMDVLPPDKPSRPLTTRGAASDRVPQGALLLGVDGGGPTTQAVLANASGEVLARGLAPSSNHHQVGIDAACQALSTAIEAAFARLSGLQFFSEAATSWAQNGRIAAAYFGLAGVDGPQDEALFAGWLQQKGATFKYTVANDATLILGGGTPEGWGVALISGTGSICFGRTPDGLTRRIGGWGHVLGDEGSGYQIAVDALKLATQAADGRGGSPALLQAALHHWKIEQPPELIAHVEQAGTTADAIAGFAARVLELANRNDPAARELVDHAAQALAIHVDTVIESLGLQTPPLALGGPMMRVSLKKTVLEKIRSAIGPVSVVADPVQGAVMSARRIVQATAA